MQKHNNQTNTTENLWAKELFKTQKPVFLEHAPKKSFEDKSSNKIAATSDVWISNLFKGYNANLAANDRMSVLKDGVVVQEIMLEILDAVTIIGRHPSADIQLESYKLGMFHLGIIKHEQRYYVESMDLTAGCLINRKKMKLEQWVLLRDGYLVDIPGYQLRFDLPNTPAPEEANDDTIELEELLEIPDFFYTPKIAPPALCPLMSHLVDNREAIKVWSEGTTTLVVADIVEETHDTKTFRFVGETPLLFSYKPGQFATFLLPIDGKIVQRSYSMSSSPSRPHVMEITVKRVPGGLVSNWLCDNVKLGDRLNIRGPSGKFTCFEYPSSKMLFIGAGSGITPVMSMSRWVADTAADVDVKLLACFRSPNEIIFRKELELLSARHRSFQVAVTVTSGWQGTESWTGFTRRISAQMIQMIAPDFMDRHLFMCGPEPFMDSVRQVMQGLGFNMNNFHMESFGSARTATGDEDVKKVIALSGTQHKVHFSKTGITVDTDENIPLLNLAEAHGIEIDYSCRSGSCGACAVKCSGEIIEGVECGIGKKEKEAGYIYACCSVAKGDLEISA
jgi:ferredoxin-NADP reductase